jgi:dTDP-4-dehydrorhamnose reductase
MGARNQRRAIRTHACCLAANLPGLYTSLRITSSVGDGVYDEHSPPCPISAYGRTRVEAETLALSRPSSLVIRVGLPIGASPNGRTGHLDWLGYRMRRGLPVTIVHDEYRSAVWAGDLAQRVIQLAHSGQTGICHVVASHAVSRVELANYLLSSVAYHGQVSGRRVVTSARRRI